MKIAYVLFGNLNQKDAHAHHCLSFASNLSKKEKIIFFSSYISKNNLKELFSFFDLEKNFKILKWPFLVVSNNFLLEQIARFFCSLFTLIYLKLHKFDIVYTTDFSFVYFLSLIPSFARPKIPIVFESHKIYFKTSLKVSKQKEFRAYKLVDYFVSNSSNCKKDLISLFGISEDKIEICPNTVDNAYFYNFKLFPNAQADKFWRDKDCLKVIYSGSFLSWKGIDILIDSLKYLDKNIKLIMIGANKDDVENLNIKSSNFIFLGKLNKKNMTNLLLRADLGVLSNNFDSNNRYTSPMKVPEYMAAGLAIIAPDILKHSDFFYKNTNIIFFETGNSKDLANKINFLNRNRDLHIIMSKNSLVDARKFDINLRSEKISKLFTAQ